MTQLTDVNADVLGAAMDWIDDYNSSGSAEFTEYDGVSHYLGRDLTDAERDWLTEHIVLCDYAVLRPEPPH